MTLQQQTQIASFFPIKCQEFNLELQIPNKEFEFFERGVFAINTHAKWDVFVFDNFMYWADFRSDNWIFKISIIRKPGFVTLEKALVTKDIKPYRDTDIKEDKIQLLKLIQLYLGRDDIYVDPIFNLDLVKKIILNYDPNNECKKSLGHNNAGLTRQIHDGITTGKQKEYFEVIGWTELKNNIATKTDKEPLLSLCMQNKKTNSGITYYFDKTASELLGHIIIERKLSNS